ncbi:hypothetical protein [Methanoculleus receptaculi]|uniref:PGF-pre-PGF domain-containing protein n=1 Tax=Methanoculleus receptaculi TaxID=394967 RepID=A0AAX4FVA6_9EURY|nr:hypothetical protein [Methanoculleus receptaculi]WOX57214.1 hypothetical protein R6Y96_07870 [Methanoculleus receptaculi]
MRFNVLCLIVLSLLCCLVPGASAVSISISPSQIQEGDTITVSYSGLSNGSVFALRMESLVDVAGETSFTYQANQVSMPFGLNSPQVVLSASPVTEAGIEASEGETIKRITQISRTGTVSISQSLGNLPAGTMELIKAFGTPEEGVDAVNVVLEFSGVKMGPDSGAITFSLTGITDGSAHVIALVDGNIVTDQTILVGNPTITTPTTSPTTPPPSGGSGGSSGGGATETPTAAPETVTVSSLDGIVTLETVDDAIDGAAPADLRIIRSTPSGVPDEWQVLAGSYIISPSAATFDPAAALSFNLSGVNATTPFIAVYRDGAWTVVPSRYEGETRLAATVSSGGQYALMAYAAVGAGDDTTPVETETAPMTTTEAAATTTPATAWGTAGVIGALVVAVALRRQRP